MRATPTKPSTPDPTSMLLSVFVLALSAWSTWTSPQVAGTDDAVVKIDGTPISGAEYGLWLLRSEGETLARDFAFKQWVIDREAKRLGIEIQDSETSAVVQGDFKTRILNAFLGRKEEWLRELARTGRSEGGLTRQRMMETKPLLQAKAIASIDRVVPEDKIRREWELHYGRNGNTYDLLMMKFKVVVPTLPGATRDEWKAERRRCMEEQRDKALAVKRRVLAGASFAELARSESSDPDTSEHGGVPSGGFSHFGWPESFLVALEALAPGDVSDPIYARGGFWLVKVLSIVHTPLEDVREAITADLARRGPESDEIAAVQTRLAQGVEVKVLPTMYEARENGEFPGAFEAALEIDGEPVRRGEYARWILHTQGEILAPHFAEEWLVEKRARELGIQVSEEEIQARTNEFVEWLVDGGYKGSRESWLAFLTASGRSEDSFLRTTAWRTRIDLMAEKMLLRERTVSADEVRNRWRDVYGEDGRRIDARVLYVETRPGAVDPKWSREKLAQHLKEASQAARARAAELAQRARSGEDFGALAKAYSDHYDTRDQGGALTERFRSDIWGDPAAKAVAALGPDQVSDPVEFGNGWLIVQVTSVRKVAFEDVAQELEHELMTRRPSSPEIAGYRNTLLKQAKVEVLGAMYE